ncbi:MAG: ferrous iron transporter B [Phycisphaeraceae bacterium]|nr:ferrous iron transporter B [Phycisphaeraceae bacterium]
MTQAGSATPARVDPLTGRTGLQRIALVGNPNTGKTTLFNRLTGLRHRTANFPGTTVEARFGRLSIGSGRAMPAPSDPIEHDTSSPDCCDPSPRQAPSAAHDAALIDLPGVYSLELEQLESTLCRDVLAGAAAAKGDRAAPPEAICVVIDATNLARNLLLVGEVLRRRLPTVVAVNMIDLAHRQGLRIDPARLGEAVGCEVVNVSARTGEGLGDLRAALARARIPNITPGANDAALREWADRAFIAAATLPAGEQRSASAESLSDRMDRAFTHPVLGSIAFALIMGVVFYALFALAKYPMDGIDWLFTGLGDWLKRVIPGGVLRELLADGIVRGVGATVIFLPQICLLFFLIALLEDTGYLARAAFVMDRVLRPFGLPGHSFVPLLSSHACALPGIMATRTIPDRRERLATILVAPFMTCSARLPVYVLLISILFRDQPVRGALAFVGCYALGIAAGVGSALLARRTILKGASRAMALELPSYKRPSLRTAAITTYDRAMVFVRNAGTNILVICIVLWWLSAYPHVPPPQESVDLRARAALVEHSSAGEAGEAEAAELLAQADSIEHRHARANSFAGMAGRALEPVFRPLGFDWQLTIGVLSSFAAREVFVSTMAVVTTGRDEPEDEGVLEQVAQARRDDGGAIFNKPTAWSLLVFYVLAMQCLPTLAVTAKEAGGARWAWLQLAWMSAVAYAAALIAFWVAS